MAIKIFDKFSPRANAPSANYPVGSIKNESVPGVGDGTPLDAEWGNDYAGFDAALLAAAEIEANGNPDTAVASQRLEAMKVLFQDHSKQTNRDDSGAHPASAITTTSGVSVQEEIDQIKSEWSQVNKGLVLSAINERFELPEGVQVGDPINWAGYYERGDGGDGSGVVKEGAHNEDGLSIFTIDANTYIEAYLGQGPLSIIKAGGTNSTTTSSLPAFNAVRDKIGPDGTIYLPGPATYYFAGARPDLSGINIYSDADVTIRVDENPNTKEMQLLTPVTIENTVHVTTLEKSANTKIQLPELFGVAPNLFGISSDESSEMVDFTSWMHKVYVLSTGNITSTNGTGSVSAGQITWSANFIENPQVIYPSSISDGVFYETNAHCFGATDGKEVGVFARLADRMCIASVQELSGELKVMEVSFSGSLISSTLYDLPNGGAYGWVPDQEVNLGFITSNSVTTFIVNGLPVFKFPEGTTNAGFFFSVNGDYRNVTIKDPIQTENYKQRLKRPVKLGVIGDSISYGAWCSNDIVDLLPAFCQNLPEVGKVSVVNHAVSGTVSSYWATGAGSGVDLSSYDVVLCMIGTNDQQSNVSVSSYIANLNTIANNVMSAGAAPIFGVFPIYTQSSLSGVTGVTTQNYANHAKYTHALKKFCIQNGFTFADMRRNFGCNLDWYGDNIHPTVEGQMPIMAAWTEAILTYSKIKKGWLLG